MERFRRPEAFQVTCFRCSGEASEYQRFIHSRCHFIAVTTFDFVVAPTYLFQGDVAQIFRNGDWGRLVSVDDVKMETVPYVKSSESVELRIKGFNLSDLLASYNGQDHTLWPWGLRVNVHVINREMRRVALGQTTLRIIPTDSRLRAK